MKQPRCKHGVFHGTFCPRCGGIAGEPHELDAYLGDLDAATLREAHATLTPVQIEELLAHCQRLTQEAYRTVAPRVRRKDDPDLSKRVGVYQALQNYRTALQILAGRYDGWFRQTAYPCVGPDVWAFACDLRRVSLAEQWWSELINQGGADPKLVDRAADYLQVQRNRLKLRCDAAERASRAALYVERVDQRLGELAGGYNQTPIGFRVDQAVEPGSHTWATPTDGIKERLELEAADHPYLCAGHEEGLVQVAVQPAELAGALREEIRYLAHELDALSFEAWIEELLGILEFVEIRP